MTRKQSTTKKGRKAEQQQPPPAPVGRDNGEGRAEEQLLRRLEFTRAVTDSMGEGVYALDREGRVTFMNPAAERMLGWTEGELLGKNMHDAIHFQRADGTRVSGKDCPLLAVIETGTTYASDDDVFTRRDGTLLPVAYTSSPVRAEEGVIGAVLTFRDIGARKNIERELREEKEALEIINRVGQTIAGELDLQKLVQAVTDACTELTGARFGSFFYNVLDEHGASYMLYTLSGVPREAFSHFPMPRATDLFGPTFRGEGVLRIADVKQDPRYGKNSPYYGMPEGHLPVTSYLAVPVVSRSGEVIGGLFFGHPDEGVFEEKHERIVVGLAAQAAIAIDNARLFQAARDADRAKNEVLAELRASAERLNLAMSASRMGDWSWDVDSDVVTLSERAAEIFGVAPGPQMTWTELRELLHEEDRERVRMAVERAISEHEDYDVDYRIIRADGEGVWVSAHGRTVYDSDGKPQTMFGIVQDITARRQAAEERERLTTQIEAERRRLKDLVGSVPGVVWEAWGEPDASGQRIDFVNDYVEELLGYTVEEWLSTPNFWLQIVHPEDRERAAIEAREKFESGRGGVNEFRWVSKDGQVIPVEAQSVVILDDEGRPVGMRGVTMDVSERKLAEQELEHQSRLTKTITDNAASCLFRMDKDGHPTFMNPAAEVVTGYTLDEIRDRPLHYAVHYKRPDGSYYPMEECPIDNASAELVQLREQEEIFVRKDGTLFPVSYSVAPIERNGATVGAVLEFRDITDLKRAESDLRASEQRYRALADAMPQLVWATDENGSHFYFNQRWYDYTGMTEAESLGFGFANALHPDDKERTLRRWERAWRDGEGYEIEYRFYSRPQAVYRWFLGRAMPVRDESGRITQWVGTCTDIEEQKQMEALLSRLNQERERMLEEVSTPVVPVLEGVLVLPLIGSLDTVRMERAMETALEEVTRTGARAVIIDITGARLVDSHAVANLSNLVGALKLVGAEPLVTGVGAHVAQNLVALGLDLSTMRTHRTLAQALSMLIRPRARRNGFYK